MQQNKTRTFLIDTLIAIAILISGMIFPMFAFFFFIPQVILGYRYGLGLSLGSFVLSCAFGVYFLGAASMLLLAPVGLFAVLFFCTMLHHRRKYEDMLLGGTLGFMLILGGFFYYVERQSGVNLFDAVKANIEHLFEMYQSGIAGNLSEEQIRALEEILSSSIDYVRVAMPGILMALSFGMAFVTLWITGIALRKLAIGNQNLPRLQEFTIDRKASAGLVIVLLTTLLLRALRYSYSEELILNIVLIFNFILGIQGLAVFDYFLAKKSGKVVRILVPILIILFLRAWPIYGFAGLIDLLFDFRKKDRERGTKGSAR